MGVQLESLNNGHEIIPKKDGCTGKPITETITNGFFTVDKNWTVIYWNKAAEELLGVPANNIMGKNIWKVFVGIIPLNFYIVYQKAFLQVNKVVTAKEVVNQSVVENDANVVVDSWQTNQIDIKDVEAFDAAGAGATTSAGALTHSHIEQLEKAKKGLAALFRCY